MNISELHGILFEGISTDLSDDAFQDLIKEDATVTFDADALKSAKLKQAKAKVWESWIR